MSVDDWERPLDAALGLLLAGRRARARRRPVRAAGSRRHFPPPPQRRTRPRCGSGSRTSASAASLAGADRHEARSGVGWKRVADERRLPALRSSSGRGRSFCSRLASRGGSEEPLAEVRTSRRVTAGCAVRYSSRATMAECTCAEDISETVEALVVELRGIAQPHEIAHLRELALDARDAETQEQLIQISKQVESLKTFCMNRAKSSAASQLDLSAPILNTGLRTAPDAAKAVKRLCARTCPPGPLHTRRTPCANVSRRRLVLSPAPADKLPCGAGALGRRAACDHRLGNPRSCALCRRCPRRRYPLEPYSNRKIERSRLEPRCG